MQSRGQGRVYPGAGSVARAPYRPSVPIQAAAGSSYLIKSLAWYQPLGVVSIGRHCHLRSAGLGAVVQSLLHPRHGGPPGLGRCELRKRLENRRPKTRPLSSPIVREIADILPAEPRVSEEFLENVVVRLLVIKDQEQLTRRTLLGRDYTRCNLLHHRCIERIVEEKHQRLRRQRPFGGIAAAKARLCPPAPKICCVAQSAQRFPLPRLLTWASAQCR